jgi:hypothetical protein
MALGGFLQSATEAEASCGGGVHAAIGVVAIQAVTQVVRLLQQKSRSEDSSALLLDVQKKLRLVLSRAE